MIQVPNSSEIIFFDGVCGLCNRFVTFLLRRKGAERYRFAPLQGKTALDVLSGEESGESLTTIVYYKRGRLFRRSGAVLRIMAGLGFFWTPVLLLLLIPAFVRDALYNFIAKKRYRWFGKATSCRIPKAQERAFFLP